MVPEVTALEATAGWEEWKGEVVGSTALDAAVAAPIVTKPVPDVSYVLNRGRVGV